MGLLRAPFLLLALFVGMEGQVTAVTRTLDRIKWSGVEFYIPVSRAALQQKLDHFNNDVGGPRLYLPQPEADEGLFPGLPTGTHPLYIEFGNITFEGSDLSNVEFSVEIPLLGLSGSGPWHYSLNVATFHDHDHGLFPEYALIPFTPVDHIKLNGTTLVVLRNQGKDRVEIRYSMPARCDAPETNVVDEFLGFMEEDFNFSPEKPTFKFCKSERGSENQRFCQETGAIEEAFPDVCVHWGSEDGKPCQAFVEVVNITDGFWDEIPMTQLEVFADEGYVGSFDLSATYPCGI